MNYMDEPYFEKQEVDASGVKYPFSCFITNNRQRDLFIKPHWHYYIEMLYSLSGQARIILGGRFYSFCKGDLALINAREVHSISAEKGTDTRYIVVKFDPEVLYTTARTVFESKYVLPFTIAKYQHQKIFTRDEIEGTYIPSLVREIHEEYGNKNYGFELAVRTNICRIFLWVLRNWQSKGLKVDFGPVLKEINLQRLQKILDFLDVNYPYDMTVEAAAKMCNMSYSYFSRQFKSIMGKPFTEYLNYIRVTEAERLLLTTDMYITEVALKTGFSDSNYFIRQFRHFKGVSPKQFRKRLMEADA